MVRLKALGQSAIEVGEVRIGPEQPYLFAIALYLIVERGKRISREALVDLIWPNVADEKHARQRFRQALLRLRESGLPVIGENGTLLLEKGSASTDFDSLSSPDTFHPGQSLEFLPHYAPRISRRFLDWVETQRSRIHANVQRIFLARMQQARTRGDWAEIEALAAECLRLDPYNEEAVMAQAECAAMRGSKREALSILDSYMEALGTHAGTIGLPAKILRTRIAERLGDQRYAMISEQHFVGRESSMELLQSLLREAQRGAGSAAFIWGEPGIGKSRLVQELTQLAELEGARVVSTKCHPTDAGRPLSAFADLVPILKTLPGALGCSAQTFSLLQRLTDRNKSDAFPQQEAGDAAFLAATIRRAVFDLVDAVADEGMLVMVIEDVHWLDEPSWAIMSAMVEWSTTRTLLILLTSRTAHATEAKVADPDRGFHRHHLMPLDDADSGTLLDKLSAEDTNPLPENVREWSVAAAEGNPFYLRELVRHWVETRQSFGVPRSLAELIEARLNRLSSLALRVLQLCAALGKHSDFARLEKATGYQNHVLLDAIEELSSAAMLEQERPGVAVRHDLLATAALNRLGAAAARLIHRQVATVLETEITEKHTAGLMWDCAAHWQHAGETAHALETVRLCANHLYSVGQLQQSIELCEKALPLCAELEERFETLFVLATGLRAADQWSRLRDVVLEALSLSEIASERQRVTDSLHLLEIEANWRLHQGRESNIAALLQFAEDDTKHAVHRLQAVLLGMIQCAEAMRQEDATRLFAVVDRIEPEPAQRALVAHVQMIFHSDYGDVDRALEYAKTLLALEAQSCDLGSQIRARTNVACCFRRVGNLADAARLLEATWDIARHHGLDGPAALTATRMALNAIQDDDFSTAQVWRDRAMPYAEALDDQAYAHTLRYVSARIGLHVGDLAPAEAYLASITVPDAQLNYRLRQTVAVIRCRVLLSRREPVDDLALSRMASEFEQYCDRSQHDYFALTICETLVAEGRQAEAHRLLAEYLRRRRERGPLPRSLATAINRINRSV
jgi:DNA-binding SARP family transcriptional activator/tetratricopeptide (TPR) repeat protein